MASSARPAIIAGSLQHHLDDLPNQNFIFNDEDGCHFHLPTHAKEGGE
jgi:hypothetical protein